MYGKCKNRRILLQIVQFKEAVVDFGGRSTISNRKVQTPPSQKLRLANIAKKIALLGEGKANLESVRQLKNLLFKILSDGR